MVEKKGIERLKTSLIKEFNPNKIFLFGSHAKNLSSEKSDIDICIVADVEDKELFEEKVISFIYDTQGLNFNKSVDIVLYTVEEWENSLKDPGTFANLIKKNGLSLHER